MNYTVGDLIYCLSQVQENLNLRHYYELSQDCDTVLIDINFRLAKEKSVKEFIRELREFDRELEVKIDIEDGYTYANVIGLRTVDNSIDFIDKVYK